jgi:hypothetical protein
VCLAGQVSRRRTRSSVESDPDLEFALEFDEAAGWWGAFTRPRAQSTRPKPPFGSSGWPESIARRLPNPVPLVRVGLLSCVTESSHKRSRASEALRWISPISAQVSKYLHSR